jgi:hypothetical protein
MSATAAASGRVPHPGGELRDRWHVARDEALMAYRVWCEAASADKRDAHAAYLAAADRESAGAEELRRRTITPAG